MIPASPLLVPDTSVVAKWLLSDEEDAAEALALRAAYLNGTVLLVLPVLVLYELANVLQQKRNIRVTIIGEFLRQLMRLRCPIVAPDPPHLARAVTLARTSGLSSYDAAFAILAQDLGGTFVSADDRLLAKLPVGFPAISLRHWRHLLTDENV